MGQAKKQRTDDYFKTITDAVLIKTAQEIEQDYNFGKLIEQGVIVAETTKQTGAKGSVEAD